MMSSNDQSSSGFSIRVKYQLLYFLTITKHQIKYIKINWIKPHKQLRGSYKALNSYRTTFILHHRTRQASPIENSIVRHRYFDKSTSWINKTHLGVTVMNIVWSFAKRRIYVNGIILRVGETQNRQLSLSIRIVVNNARNILN